MRNFFSPLAYFSFYFIKHVATSENDVFFLLQKNLSELYDNIRNKNYLFKQNRYVETIKKKDLLLDFNLRWRACLSFYPEVEIKEGKKRAEGKKKDMSDEVFALFLQLVFFKGIEEKSLNHSKRTICRACLQY